MEKAGLGLGEKWKDQAGSTLPHLADTSGKMRAEDYIVL